MIYELLPSQEDTLLDFLYAYGWKSMVISLPLHRVVYHPRYTSDCYVSLLVGLVIQLEEMQPKRYPLLSSCGENGDRERMD